MSQNKTTLIWAAAFMCFLAFSSCAKKTNSVKSQVKTQQVSANPGTESQANLQAAAVSANYKIKSISLPNYSSSGYTVDVELQTPANQILPVTTRHENGLLDSQGVYNDTERNLQIYVQARCSSDECTKYIVVITAVRSNQAVYQTSAISYKTDCKFTTTAASTSVGQFYTNLNQAESGMNVAPHNDISSCQM